jgi:hypothetical protein
MRRQQKNSFGEAFGTTVGVGLGIGLVVLVFNGAKLVFETWADYNQWRVNNPSEFDASVIEGMRARGWDTLEARAFWDSLLLWPYEKQRIEAKLKFARPSVVLLPPLKTCVRCGAQYYSKCGSQACNPPRKRKCAKCGEEFLSKYSLFGYVVRCADCRPKRKANPRRHNRRRNPSTKKAAPPQLKEHEALQLNAAPPEQPPAPAESPSTAKPAKQTKRHGKSGRMTKDTKERAIYYAGLRVNKGVSHRAALLRTAQHFAHSGHREDVLLRSVRTAVRNHLDNGRDLGKLRRFLENASKRA